MLNDESMEAWDVLSLVEPYVYEDPVTNRPTVGTHGEWLIFLPTRIRGGGMMRHKYKSTLWVHTRHHARQVALDSPDLTGALLFLPERTVFVVAAYDPRDRSAGVEASNRSLAEKLTLLSDTIRDLEQKHGDALDGPITSDFNRHHPLWSGSRASSSKANDDGEQVMTFLQDMHPQSLLPPGTITWHHQGREQSSCIDVMMASDRLVASKIKCRPSRTDHGSDHFPIEMIFEMKVQVQPSTKTRFVFDKADWTAMQEELSGRLPPVPQAALTFEDLDDAAERFHGVITEVVEQRVPRARPSSYAKRWWGEDLTVLRQSLTAARNKVTTLKRRGQDTGRARTDWKLARQPYFWRMEQRKRDH
ncbi:Hypothetical protein D9617_69g077960 [Elsinoe fawcettii]|nr:Hypothetical protein D9617_69g077960 [Elsinoe fawcettii]